MSRPAIHIENLSKLYRIGRLANQPTGTTWGETAASLLRGPLKHLRGNRVSGQPPTIWALKEVSLEVQAGEVLGIIGCNGAGKSTLLKILAGITEPTAGRVVVRGRLASLLEVGTGFHPELTGRENVFLNGVILGMHPREVRRKFDAIVAFAEIEKFIDTPVKFYSSGMYMRLAFAVAAHLDPEILLVDEVLAVGDAAFQQRCLGKMEDVAWKQGRTILFVSHNLGAIQSLCRRAIFLDRGELVLDGDPAEVVSAYLSRRGWDSPELQQPVVQIDPASQPGETEGLILRAVQLLGPSGLPQALFEADKPIKIEIYYELTTPIRGLRINLHIITADGVHAFISTDQSSRSEEAQSGLYCSTCVIPGGLLNRTRYFVGIESDVPSEQRVILPRKEYTSFTVSGMGNHGSTFSEGWPGVVCPRLNWRVEAVHSLPMTTDPVLV